MGAVSLWLKYLEPHYGFTYATLARTAAHPCNPQLRRHRPRTTLSDLGPQLEALRQAVLGGGRSSFVEHFLGGSYQGHDGGQ